MSESQDFIASSALCWITPAYGAPTATSEVRRIENFYSAERLTVFGTNTVEGAETARADGAVDCREAA